MCLAIPMGLVERTELEGVVELDGVRRTVSLMMLPEAAVGDYLLIHAGFAIGRVDEEEAARDARAAARVRRRGGGVCERDLGVRDPRAVAGLLGAIRTEACRASAARITLMEVCGTHTHAIAAPACAACCPSPCA